MHPIIFSPCGNQLHFSKAKIRTPDDMKGKKFYAPVFLARYLNSLGGALVDMNIGEWYSSLNSGLIDGIGTVYAAMYVFKCLPLTPYHTNAGVAGFSSYFDSIVINNDTLKSLPLDVQKVFNDLEPWLVEEMIKMDQAELQRALTECKKANHIFIDLTPEEIQIWAEAAKPIHEQWIKENEDKGLPGKAVFEEAQRLIKKISM